jgi:hypothetical protein
MERYLVDSNLPDSIRDAAKPANRDKAFILGQTFTDEQENLENAILGHDNSNNNLFEFGYVGTEVLWTRGECIMINRLDEHQPVTFDKEGLRLESRPRQKRKQDDPNFIEREKKREADNCQFKAVILNEILKWPDITNLPPAEYRERKKAQLIEMVRSKSAHCFKNYGEAVGVASHCYSALLLEPDEVGRKTRQELHDENGNPKRNCFGDTRLIQNALWLNSRIISKDVAVKRMVSYLNLRHVIVKEVV